MRGVVANEMGYTYPLEALKAQAIAARSYGFKSINKHKNYGFDLCTTQDCQVYRGYVRTRQHGSGLQPDGRAGAHLRRKDR